MRSGLFAVGPVRVQRVQAEAQVTQGPRGRRTFWGRRPWSGWWGRCGALLGIALVLAGLTYSVSYADRIQPGVHALGMDLSGLPQPEARQRLAARLDAMTHVRPALRYDGAEVALPAMAFGEPETLAARFSEAAVQVGRETLLSRVAVPVRAAVKGGTTVQLPAADTHALREALATVAASVDRPGVDTHIVLDHADPTRETLRVEIGQPGRRLDVDRTADGLATAFAAAGSTASRTGTGSTGVAGAAPAARVVDATLITLAPALDEAQLETAKQRLAARLAQPSTVIAGEGTWPIARPGRLIDRIILTSTGASGTVFNVVLDEPTFAALSAQILAASARAPQDARLEAHGDGITLIPAIAGAAVDPTVLRDALTSGLLADSPRIDVPVQPVPAHVSTETLAPLRSEANRLIAEPVHLTRGERRWTLAPQDLARLLSLPAGSAQATPEASGVTSDLRLDEARLRATLSAMATESNRAGNNARLAVQDGAVITVPGEEGETLDVPATAAAIQAAFRVAGSGTDGAAAGESSARTVAVATRPLPPEIGEAKLEPARAQAVRIINGSLTARSSGKTWTISQDEVASMLLFGESAGGSVPYLSRNTLLEKVQPIAEELNPQLENNYLAALKMWETHQAERAAAAAAEAARAAAQAAAQAENSGAPPPATLPATPPVDEPQPKRQWVDVPATAAALWVQATTNTRVVDVRLTIDDPAAGKSPAGLLPADRAAQGKWIDINVTSQSLVAYEGDWPVFTSLVSTGLPRTPTPVGTYRVFTKLVADDMRGGSVATGDAYFLPKVPYVMYFLDGGYAIHGTFWHNNFGNPMSHGCVNLPTQNSKWLFDWAPMGTTVVVHR